jgi:hypothetical protein
MSDLWCHLHQAVPTVATVTATATACTERNRQVKHRPAESAAITYADTEKLPITRPKKERRQSLPAAVAETQAS